MRGTFAQLAWLDVAGLEDAVPDCAGTLNCDEDDEPSSLLVPNDEPPDDEPDDELEDDELEDEEGVVVTVVDAFAALCAPAAMPPASANVAPILNAPTATRLRCAGCGRR